MLDSRAQDFEWGGVSPVPAVEGLHLLDQGPDIRRDERAKRPLGPGEAAGTGVGGELELCRFDWLTAARTRSRWLRHSRRLPRTGPPPKPSSGWPENELLTADGLTAWPITSR